MTRHATSRAGDRAPYDHVFLANVVRMGGRKAARTSLWREHIASSPGTQSRSARGFVASPPEDAHCYRFHVMLSSADGDRGATGDRQPVAAGTPGAARAYLGDRLSDQYRDHYHLIASVFTGVVLAGAAISLLAILATDEPAGPRGAALSLWLGSFASVICTYNGPLVNSILITRAPNFVDVFTPFLVGVMGFAQFAVIVPIQPAGTAPAAPALAQVHHLTWWFLAAAAVWAVVLPNLSNTLAQVRATAEESPEDVAPLVRWCEGIVRKALQGTIAITLSLLGAFLLLRTQSTERLWKWQALLGLGYFVGMAALVMIQEQARHTMVASVSDEVTVD